MDFSSGLSEPELGFGAMDQPVDVLSVRQRNEDCDGDGQDHKGKYFPVAQQDNINKRKCDCG